MGLNKCLVTKPSIAGFGMNWQQCHNMIFVGLSDSYEQYYQAVRRCWRFGQTQPVDVYIIISSREGCVQENIERKQRDSEQMRTAMAEQTREITKKELRSTCRLATPYTPAAAIKAPAKNLRKLQEYVCGMIASLSFEVRMIDTKPKVDAFILEMEAMR